MAWSKYSTSTLAWDGDNSSPIMNRGLTNAANDGGNGVLEEYVAFLVTRGWVLNSYERVNVQDGSSNLIGYNYVWSIYKDVVCEDSTVMRTGFILQYGGRTDSNDTVELFLYDYTTDSYGFNLFTMTVETSDALCGKWDFWVSDEDNDAFLILDQTASRRVMGFWPPSGSMFTSGYSSTSHPVYAGMAPLTTGSGPCWDAALGSGNREFLMNMAGNSSYNQGMSSIPEKLDFTWIGGPTLRPVFMTAGGDISAMINYSENQSLNFVNNESVTNVIKIGEEYFISIGRKQRLLLSTGSNPPVF